MDVTIFDNKKIRFLLGAERVFEIHYKQIRVIFQLKNTFIEVSYILNKYAFPPNGNPVYEAF